MASEKRLIDANALKSAMYLITHVCNTETIFIDAIIDEIDNADDVDAVEVVRCNKCSYWDKATVNKKGYLICPASGMEITADDFCSYGERKDK